MSTTLYHYTCSHAAPNIRLDGYLQPMPQPLIPGVPYLVWMTDLPEPDKLALGLQSTILNCDRTEHRFRVVVASDAQAFDDWADDVELDEAYRSTLCDGREPEHWWVSALPVLVEESPIGIAPENVDPRPDDDDVRRGVRPYGNRTT